jgi:hypothetical protein
MSKRDQYPRSLLDEENDAVGMICLGRGERFEGNVCPHYARSTGECVLLRERGMGGVLEFERCLTEKELLWRLFRVLQSFGKNAAAEMVDLQEFLQGRQGTDDLRPTKGLLSKRPPQDKIAALYGFVNIELYSYTKEVLRKRGVIPGRRRCGNCKHLPPSEPRACQLRNILDKRTGRRIENSHYGSIRRAHDSVCEGYEPLSVLFAPIGNDERSGQESGDVRLSDEDLQRPWEDKISIQVTVDQIWRLMEHCRSSAPTAKRREMETRRIEDLRFLEAMLKDGESLEGARSLLIDQKAVTPKEREATRRKLDRDLEAVEKCLTQPGRCKLGQEELTGQERLKRERR